MKWEGTLIWLLLRLTVGPDGWVGCDMRAETIEGGESYWKRETIHI